MDVTQNISTLLSSSIAFKGFLAYCLACFLGQIANAAWLWLKKEIPCVIDRFRHDVRATVVAVLTNLGAIAAIAYLIPFDQMPLQAAIIMGAMQGFSSDSAINKTTRRIWTAEERTVAEATGSTPPNPPAT
ncbi:hypothetical protein UFOVP1670_33 [uncultured Caudovirales phage]|uniref:Holin n=1 Tax=uncultured Caudovirales phage TaxID=2100421 RepID=A0A6J5T6L2_9CAUD|nr:hypothetical protein UFOVP1670_33 [uncultured Caudovirales phage]